MKIVSLTLIALLLAQPVSAIEDLSQKDPSYKAVQTTLKDGYLSLYNNKFNGSNPVSRKEMAVAIDKLLKKMDQKGYNLSQAEVQELVQLSKTFKTHLRGIEATSATHENQLLTSKSQQETIQHDLSKLNDELRAELATLKKENDEQHLYMMIAIGIAGILGLAK